jgi:ribosomal protein L17
MSAVRRAQRRRLARARWTSSARKQFLLELAERLAARSPGYTEVVVRLCRREAGFV